MTKWARLIQYSGIHTHFFVVLHCLGCFKWRFVTCSLELSSALVVLRFNKMKSSNVYDVLVHDIAIKQAKDFLGQCYSAILMLLFLSTMDHPLICSLSSIRWLLTKHQKGEKKVWSIFHWHHSSFFIDIIKTLLTFETKHEKCYTRTIANL